MSDRLAVVDVVGLSARHLGPHTPALNALAERGGQAVVRPVFPALTCPVQSTYITGLAPGEHGVVGNGWYDRELAEHQFWKQSNHLVQGEKVWETARRERPGFTCAVLFWWFNMYSSADWSVTPRPMYPADGRKVFDIYTHPPELRDAIPRDLGAFPFPAFWGPVAGIRSSEWIAQAARWIEEHHQPDLNLVYLPHLDYNLQRLGPDDPAIASDLAAIDRVAGDLIAFLEARGVRVLVVSEYGITPVRRCIHLNREFRKQGWISVRNELGRELLDCGASRVFAIADHQIAHVHVHDPGLLSAVDDLLSGIDGIAEVLGPEEKAAAGIEHPRCGDLVAVAAEDAWFSYYYWMDDDVAPDFARCVDIHRKFGFDPVELFFDPAIRFPRLRVASRVLRGNLGLRRLMDVVPLDTSLVRGSHGAVPADPRDWPVVLGAGGHEEPLSGQDVHRLILDQATGLR